MTWDASLTEGEVVSETLKPLDLDRDVVRDPRLRAETSSQGGEFLPLDSPLGFCLHLLFGKKKLTKMPEIIRFQVPA